MAYHAGYMLVKSFILFFIFAIILVGPACGNGPVKLDSCPRLGLNLATNFPKLSSIMRNLDVLKILLDLTRNLKETCKRKISYYRDYSIV